MATLAEIVIKHRTASGMSQQALADAADIHRTYIARIETDKQKDPSLTVLAKLTKALGEGFLDDVINAFVMTYKAPKKSAKKSL